MNAIQLSPTGPRLDTPERCEVAVVYDDIASRVRAMHLSESLANRFEGDLDFNFTWWNIRFLKDPQISNLAEEAAAEADLVLFSIGEAAEPAPALKAWIRRWLARRQSDEGALAVLLDQTIATKDHITPLESYLRKVADGGHMDFLPRMMPVEPDMGPDSPNRKASVSDNSVRKSFGVAHQNSHWGINE